MALPSGSYSGTSSLCKNRLLWFRLFRSVSFMETLTSSTS
ncbi:hypothetical protein CISIN_1g0345511mg, partial [Citrus sinensis]